MSRHLKPDNCVCLNCNKSFKTNAAYLKRGGGKYCTVPCMREYKSRSYSISIDSAGYLSQHKKRIHRVIMEKYLNRKLDRKEHVHHINGDKADNRIENLILLSESEHHKLHPTPKIRFKKICICCGIEFDVISCELKTRSFCSPQCYWKMKKGTYRKKFWN